MLDLDFGVHSERAIEDSGLNTVWVKLSWHFRSDPNNLIFESLICSVDKWQINCLGFKGRAAISSFHVK